ncbi:MAG TPA: hypothetical protein VK536_03795 [Candidatus Limnocylindrales bacterium]|nr:hypothetical protein [Candidatus Limnocylindrales bacterium]
METPKFKLSDIFYAVIIPLIVVLLIYVIAVYVNPGGTHVVFGLTGAWAVIGVIFSTGLAQMIILGIPLVLGLIWNKWAGGAAGFIMGGLYYVASAGLYTGYYEAVSGHYNFFGDLSLMGYLVNAIVIGYMAGALNNGSSSFKRMVGAGLTAAVITSVLQAYFNYSLSLSPAMSMNHSAWASTQWLGIAGFYEGFIAFFPALILGIIVPVIAKVMTWYGLQPMRH